MGGDFCRKPFPAAMNRTAATASRKLLQTVSCRCEPHWCRAGQETFRHRFLPLCAAILSRRAGNPFTPKELSYDYHFPYLLPFLCL